MCKSGPLPTLPASQICRAAGIVRWPFRSRTSFKRLKGQVAKYFVSTAEEVKDRTLEILEQQEASMKVWLLFVLARMCAFRPALYLNSYLRLTIVIVILLLVTGYKTAKLHVRA